MTLSGERIGRDELARPVLDVARDLLGCRIARGGVVVRITETEAYAGGTDPASTVLARPTPHNAPVFGPAGHAFVYFTYGHHWMLCVVTDGPGVPNVVLVRAAEVVSGHDVVASRRGAATARDWCRGPGRLTRAIGVTGSNSGSDLCGDEDGDGLSLWSPASEDRPAVLTGPRVGVRGPGGDGTAYPWRFWLEGEPTVSPYRRAAPRPPARPRRGS
ncbi:MAG: DNA-3-methyladenine glycosylase [Terracoccus sp.]